MPEPGELNSPATQEPSAAQIGGAPSLEERVVHAEAIKIKALVELGEALQKIKALQAQTEHLNRQLVDQPNTGPRQQQTGAVGQQPGNDGSAVPDSWVSPHVTDASQPDELWGRLQEFHERLTAWEEALRRVREGVRVEQEEVVLERLELAAKKWAFAQDRHVLAKRQRGHQENGKALERSLAAIREDRSRLQAEISTPTQRMILILASAASSNACEKQRFAKSTLLTSRHRSEVCMPS